MLLGMFVGGVNRNVALSAQNCSVLLTEQESSSLLTDIAERGLFGRGGVDKREALVFGCELIGVVDAVVTALAQSRLVGGAEHRGVVLVAHVTLDLHLFN